MKTFQITEAQIGEIAGRLDMIAKGGLPAAACVHVGGIHAVLEAIVAAAAEQVKDERKPAPKKVKGNGHAPLQAPRNG